MDIRAEVLAADLRIDPFVHRTRVERSPWLSEMCDGRVRLKMENHQHTGSFKFRGAMNNLLTMDAPARARGVVAASTGNHGAAVSRGSAALGCTAVIFAPETASPAKLDAIRAQGAEVRCVGDDCLQAEAAARAHATEHDLTYVSPYNDAMVVAGQGTIGRELEQQLDNIDVVFLAVGGGGLISGVGGYLHALDAGIEVLGASPRNSAVMHASLTAGELLDIPSLPTLSDGTAGGVEAGSITFEMCQSAIDDFVLVTEDEIRHALRETVSRHHTMIEGAAATAVAACLAVGDRFAGKDVVIVLCGANMDSARLKEIL
jgi:threonine dehydratase